LNRERAAGGTRWVAARNLDRIAGARVKQWVHDFEIKEDRSLLP
jgi:hypothetical protein